MPKADERVTPRALVIDAYDQVATAQTHLTVGLGLLVDLCGELVDLQRMRREVPTHTLVPTLAAQMEWVIDGCVRHLEGFADAKAKLKMLQALTCE